MYFLTSLAHHFFLSRFTFLFQLKPLLILVLSQVTSPSIFHKVQSQCPNVVSQNNPSSSTVKVANGTFLVTCGSFNAWIKPFWVCHFLKTTILLFVRVHEHGSYHIKFQLPERIHKDGKISSLQAKKKSFSYSNAIRNSQSQLVWSSCVFFRPRYLSGRHYRYGWNKP